MRRAWNCEDALLEEHALGVGVCRSNEIEWWPFFGSPLCVAVKR